jgi:hypothetical protein
MTRYPGKFKKIKRVQFVERAVPGYGHLHPKTHPRFFTDGGRKVNQGAIKQLAKALNSKGWLNVHAELKPNGIIIVYGQCIGNKAVFDGAQAGMYDVSAKPPNLG